MTGARGLSVALGLWLPVSFLSGQQLSTPSPVRYYGHPKVEDRYGVIAPWYHGLNGQADFRVRIAAETLKRYPWVTGTNSVMPAPAYVFSGSWQISSNGVITPRDPGDWGNGDLGQRATSTLNGFVDYYRYTGDPAAIAQIAYMADFLVDHCVTPPDHPWPGLFISVPVKGKAFWDCSPHGMIQLDLCASVGQGLLRAAELTGNPRWLQAAEHWGDVLADHCNLDPRSDPWPRYANPDDTPWKDDKQTGGVTMILGFLDELIRLGHLGQDNRILAAQDAGRRYLSQKLLPAWLERDTWGRYFWDWVNDCQNCLTTPDAATYLLNHPKEFPNWRCDARNILTLFLNRSSVSPKSGGDVYSGAWAYPESAGCCERSLWYAPLDLAPSFAQYAVAAEDPWMRELAYRQVVLQTYDGHENGVTEDNIDGGVIVNGDWFNIAHPMPLRFLLGAMGWLPEELGPSRENHIVRSSAVITSVRYQVGRIDYATFDAPSETVEVMRLAFAPKRVTANGTQLRHRQDLESNGYAVKRLSNGDAIVAIRHDGATHVVVTGADPQREIPGMKLERSPGWQTQTAPSESHVSAERSRRDYLVTTAGAESISGHFHGNQLRVIGSVGPDGGLAEVYLDGERQLVSVDSWNPAPRQQQVLYYRNGLPQGTHTIKLVVRGEGNPRSTGTRVAVEGVQYSAATGAANFPTATGPREAQRLIFGYPEREDYWDSGGRYWRPGTEFVSRMGNMVDTVATNWWTTPAAGDIAGTIDPELFRYGIHGRDFWVNLTVGPGTYRIQLKFAATRGLDPSQNRFDIRINEEYVARDVDVAAQAGGPNRPLSLLFKGVRPRNGIIRVRFTALDGDSSQATTRGEAFVQALELEPEW
jgi:hypothetical protein